MTLPPAYGSGGAGGKDYSTDEQDSGQKWHDGRTIYQKTLTGTTGTGALDTIPHGITDYDVLIEHKGAIVRSAGTKQYCALGSTEHPSVIGDQILVTVDETNILFVFGASSSQWDTKAYHITIFYVKV